MPEVDPGRDEEDALPPGEYLLAMTWFEHKDGQKGTYLRACITVISGPLEGRSFFVNMGCDTAKKGTHIRWQIYAEHVGCTDRFDTESQRDIAKHFKRKGFKARVKRETRNGRVQNDLERLVYQRLLSDEENAIVAKWNEANAYQPERGGSPQDPGGDEPPPHGDDDNDGCPF